MIMAWCADAKASSRPELAKLGSKGYVRAPIDGELRHLDEELDDIQLDKREPHHRSWSSTPADQAGIEKRLESP